MRLELAGSRAAAHLRITSAPPVSNYDSNQTSNTVERPFKKGKSNAVCSYCLPVDPVRTAGEAQTASLSAHASLHRQFSYYCNYSD